MSHTAPAHQRLPAGSSSRSSSLITCSKAPSATASNGAALICFNLIKAIRTLNQEDPGSLRVLYQRIDYKSSDGYLRSQAKVRAALIAVMSEPLNLEADHDCVEQVQDDKAPKGQPVSQMFMEAIVNALEYFRKSEPQVLIDFQTAQEGYPGDNPMMRAFQAQIRTYILK